MNASGVPYLIVYARLRLFLLDWTDTCSKDSSTQVSEAEGFDVQANTFSFSTLVKSSRSLIRASIASPPFLAIST